MHRNECLEYNFNMEREVAIICSLDFRICSAGGMEVMGEIF